MLAAGIIEPSFSEWSNLIVMIKKSNGKYRFCLDFHKINSMSKKDTYTLPNMNGILNKLRSARYISSRDPIDLSQASFQKPLAKDSREIIAFSVPDKGLYHFTRMLYGLTGPVTFQRLLDINRTGDGTACVHVLGRHCYRNTYFWRAFRMARLK